MTSRYTVSLRLDGLVSVHSVRAAHTALAAVEGIVHAEVTRRGALIEHDGRATRAAVNEALALVGLEVIEWTPSRGSLPIVGGGDTN